MVGVGGTLTAKVPPCQEIFAKKIAHLARFELSDSLYPDTFLVETTHRAELFGILETIETTGERFIGPA